MRYQYVTGHHQEPMVGSSLNTTEACLHVWLTCVSSLVTTGKAVFLISFPKVAKMGENRVFIFLRKMYDVRSRFY